MQKKKDFNIEYRELKRACKIQKFVTSNNGSVYQDKETIDWFHSDMSVYTTMLALFDNYGQVHVSVSFLAGECNLSESTVRKSLTKLTSFGVLEKLKNDCIGKVDYYTNVIDIVKDERFKTVANKYNKKYKRDKKEREKRIKFLEGLVIDKSWTPKQLHYYLKNVNYEKTTCIFLKGDKTSGLLYTHEYEVFTIKDELQSYQLNGLQEVHRVEGEEIHDNGDDSEPYNPEEIDGVPF